MELRFEKQTDLKNIVVCKKNLPEPTRLLSDEIEFSVNETKGILKEVIARCEPCSAREDGDCCPQTTHTNESLNELLPGQTAYVVIRGERVNNKRVCGLRRRPVKIDSTVTHSVIIPDWLTLRPPKTAPVEPTPTIAQDNPLPAC